MKFRYIGEYPEGKTVIQGFPGVFFSPGEEVEVPAQYVESAKSHPFFELCGSVHKPAPAPKQDAPVHAPTPVPAPPVVTSHPVTAPAKPEPVPAPAPVAPAQPVKPDPAAADRMARRRNR